MKIIIGLTEEVIKKHYEIESTSFLINMITAKHIHL